MPPHASQMFDELFELARFCASRGWLPATSGNFSVSDARGNILISRSGFDKSKMSMDDLIQLDSSGRVSQNWTGQYRNPSAEAGLHAVIYRRRSEVRAVAHVHTVWNTLISGRFASRGSVPIQGYEILKGLSGVATHEHVELVPILANSQDYALLASELEDALDKFPLAHGVLLSRHGLYTWGGSVAEARRHLECLEFLFEVEGRRLAAKSAFDPEIAGSGVSIEP